MLTQVTDAIGHSTRFSHDTNGNVLTITDANYNATTYQNETTYAYDTLGRVTSEVRATGTNGASPTFTSVDYTYDKWERRSGQRANPGAAGTGTPQVGYVYDADNNLTQFTDGNAKATTYAYDVADRLISVGRNAGHSYNSVTGRHRDLHL